MIESAQVLGIVCGGGPVPGINVLLSSIVVYAKRRRMDVLGFHDGFLHLASGDVEEVRQNSVVLDESCVNYAADASAGAILRMDRYDPSKSAAKVTNVNDALRFFRVRYLLVIGGFSQIGTSHLLFTGIDPQEMQVIFIPKTVDNDIMMPLEQSTFGFHSARAFGVELVKNLIVDAKSAPKWFIVETMGRRAGHLALSIAEATGATVSVIPEDFGARRVTLGDICDVVEGSILRKLADGENYGVCVLAEGLINQMATASIQELYRDGFIHYSSEGMIALDEAELCRAVYNELKNRMQKRGIVLRMTPKKIGYELRSCAPTCVDAIHAQDLGAGAVDGFFAGHSNCIVVWNTGQIEFKSIHSMVDPATGRLMPRKVDTKTQNYRIARSYQTYISAKDLEDKELMRKIAEVANCDEKQIVAQFGRVAKWLE